MVSTSAMNALIYAQRSLRRSVANEDGRVTPVTFRRRTSTRPRTRSRESTLVHHGVLSRLAPAEVCRNQREDNAIDAAAADSRV
jgi:hypothetical protein